MRPENMSFIGTQCEKLIKSGRIDNMQNKLDIFMATDRITTEEYTYLVGLL